MTVTIDLKARVFGQGDHAWRLFPGVSYRHYDAMKEHSRVFLDYSNLPLPGIGGFPKDDITKEVMARASQRSSVIFREFDQIERQLSEIDNSDISYVKWSQSRLLSLGWLNGLYTEARIGELIVVPGPGWRREGDQWISKKSLVGEITGNTERWEREVPPRYRFARYLTRSVRWIAELDERDLEIATRHSLRTQNALVRIRADELEPVLGAAYKNVRVDGEYLARFITRNNDFTSHESFHFQAFVMATAAALSRSQAENGQLFTDSIYAIAATVPRAAEFVPEQDSSIHSPGYTTLKAHGIIPMVVACLFALAIDATADPYDTGRNPDVAVINSESAALDPCSPDIGIEQGVRDSLRIIGYQRWQEMCEAARRANENEGFEPITSVTNE